MIFEPTTVKGFQDFLPPVSSKREAIKKIMQKYFELYGFQPVETPVVEFDELTKPSSLGPEDEAVSDRFRLKDKGGRNLSLRYEFTFQLARLLKQNPNLRLPFRKYQIGNVFRDEPVTSSRFRQFTQCDVDIIGDTSAKADAECLAVFSDILKQLKIKSETQVNNRKLMNAILESVKISYKEEVMRELDKIDKIGEDTVKANIRKYAEANQILTLFKLLEKPLDFFVKNLFEGAEDLKYLEKACKSSGVKIKFNPFMVRGLGYYTGNVFEITLEGKKDSIAGGGRYDKTVGQYLGREIPAVGISFGLERITDLAQIEVKKTTVLIISLSQNKAAEKLAQKLRKSEISCTTTYGKPGKALEYANSEQIPYTIFIGESEVAKKKFKLKDMAKGSENLLTEKQLVNKLKKR